MSPPRAKKKQPAKRHANREGNPWERGDGRWTARVYPPKGSIDADPQYVYGRDRDECVAKRDALRARLAAGIADPEDADITLGELFERWLTETLDEYLLSGDLAENTVESYRQNARLHICPYLGHIRLLALTAPMVRQWQARLLRKPSAHAPGGKAAPLSVRTVTYCRAILHAAIADAIRDERAGLERNVVDLVKPPKDRDGDGEPDVITPEEASALLLAMAQDDLWCYWLFCFALGSRRGEGLGVRWEDLDRRNRIWRPRHQVQRLKGPADPETGERGKSRLMLVPLKSKSSRQPVAVPVYLIEALALHEQQQNGVRMTAAAWSDLGLIFCTGVGTAIEPRTASRKWAAVCKAAGLRRTVGIHGLRHACASYLLKAGVDLKTVQAALRHSRMTTTMIYLHALEAVPFGAADAMDGILNALAPKPQKEPLRSALRSGDHLEAAG